MDTFIPYYAKDDSFAETLKELFSFNPEKELEMDTAYNKGCIHACKLIRTWDKSIPLTEIVDCLKLWYKSN